MAVFGPFRIYDNYAFDIFGKKASGMDVDKDGNEVEVFKTWTGEATPSGTTTITDDEEGIEGLTLDDDNDGVNDESDAFPLDASETTDTDADGVGDNADAFPEDAAETVDTDSDGIGNNADVDDDNDGVLDGADIFPFNKDESVDTDGDGTGNNADTDDDNDGVADSADDFPLNAKLSSSFRLNSVSITDYVDQDRTMATYTAAATMGDGVLTLALADGVVIDRSNLKNLVDSNSATGTAPKLVLTLDKVPTAGTTGTVMLDLMLLL